MDPADPAVDRRVDVGAQGATPGDDLRMQSGGGDAPQNLTLGRAHGRDTRLDLLYSRPVERGGDGQLLLGREGNPRGLLTVTQRGVTESDHTVVPHRCPPSVEKEGRRIPSARD
jgi:hypothetical protein